MLPIRTQAFQKRGSRAYVYICALHMLMRLSPKCLRQKPSAVSGANAPSRVSFVLRSHLTNFGSWRAVEEILQGTSRKECAKTNVTNSNTSIPKKGLSCLCLHMCAAHVNAVVAQVLAPETLGGFRRKCSQPCPFSFCARTSQTVGSHKENKIQHHVF